MLDRKVKWLFYRHSSTIPDEQRINYPKAFVVLKDATVIGAALCIKEGYDLPADAYLSVMKDEIESEDDFRYAFDNYFSKQRVSDGVICLMAIAVDEQYRGQNCGQALLSLVCSEYIKNTIELEVLDTPDSAKSLYLKNGFTITEACKEGGFASKGTIPPDILRMSRPSVVKCR